MIDYTISVTITSPKKPPARKQRVDTHKQRCAVCNQVGHNHQTCPQVPGGAPPWVAQKCVGVQNAVEEGSETPPPAKAAVAIPSTVNWKRFSMLF